MEPDHESKQKQNKKKFLLKMLKSATVREIFDEMSLNVTAFLEVFILFHSRMLSYGSFFKKIESQKWAYFFHLRPARVCLGAERFYSFNYAQGHQGVSKLTFVERGPVTSVDISSWESKHLPCVLPDDLKALLQITDGITLKWDANLHGPRRKNRKCYTHTCNRMRAHTHNTHTTHDTHNAHSQQLR